jgi:hypothetical protein
MNYQYRGANFEVEEPQRWRPQTEFVAEKCGTYAGYKQHQKFGQEACRPCKDALAAYCRDRYHARKHLPPRVYGFSPDKCGTYAGYARHKRSEVPPCEPCKDAWAGYMNEYRAQRKAAA